MNDNQYVDLYSIYNSILAKNDERIKEEEEEARKEKLKLERHYAYEESEDNFKFLIDYYLYHDFIVNKFPQIIQKFLERMYYHNFNSKKNLLHIMNFVIPISLNTLARGNNAKFETINGIHTDILYQTSKNAEITLDEDIYESFKSYLTNFICDYQIGEVVKNNLGEEKIWIDAPIEKIIYAYFLEMERLARLDIEMAKFNEEENVNLNSEKCAKLNKKIKNLI